jgi:hypothetical protein
MARALVGRVVMRFSRAALLVERKTRAVEHWDGEVRSQEAVILFSICAIHTSGSRALAR